MKLIDDTKSQHIEIEINSILMNTYHVNVTFFSRKRKFESKKIKVWNNICWRRQIRVLMFGKWQYQPIEFALSLLQLTHCLSKATNTKWREILNRTRATNHASGNNTINNYKSSCLRFDRYSSILYSFKSISTHQMIYIFAYEFNSSNRK